MKKKTVFVMLAVIIILIVGSLIFYFIKQHQIQPKTVEISKADTLRQAEIFSGDIAYLVKGKLLDQQFKGEYDEIADTLVVLSFGDKLYCTTCPYVNNGAEVAVAVTADGVVKPEDVEKYVKQYSLYEKPSDANTTPPHEKRWNKLFNYLKLAEQGKAEFPNIRIPNGEPYYTMLDWTSFNEKYSNTFTELFTQEIPYPVKDKLIALFNSDDGKNLRFITSDRRVHEDLIRYGDFTGRNKKETACVLTTNNDDPGNHWEKLFVYAYNGQGDAYLLYSEDFRDKILIETIKHLDAPSPSNLIFMDSEEKQYAAHDALRIKIPNQPDVVLVYNKEFDKMNRYLQLPKSQLDRDVDDEQ